MESAESAERTGLVIEPGWLKGKVDGAPESSGSYEVSVQVKTLSPAAREAVLAYLEEDPQALYRLLAGQDAPWLAELAPSPCRAKSRPPLPAAPAAKRPADTPQPCWLPQPCGLRLSRSSS